MDEIFNGFIKSEEFARKANEQSDTLVLTWTPTITRATALRILLRGTHAGRMNIATIKVPSATIEGATLKVCQQPDFEHTELDLMDSLQQGRGEKLEVVAPDEPGLGL